MPELPEVHTTATILDRLVSGSVITSLWSDYNSPYYKGKSNIKDLEYFKKFAKAVKGKRIVRVYRRAKNVLIDLEGTSTILIHMKMTGHLLYGKYEYDKTSNTWSPIYKTSPLAGSFSRFIHFVITLSDGNHVAFSDMRKFATVSLINDANALETIFADTGPEPLDKSFALADLKAVLLRKPKGKVKTVLMDPRVVAGIGNIYSDEILWASSIHPEMITSKLSPDNFRDMFYSVKTILAKGIDFGGDSMSDYRNPYGEKGEFQLHHHAYRRTGENCKKKNCKGKIIRKVIGGRSAHFCNVHQKLVK